MPEAMDERSSILLVDDDPAVIAGIGRMLDGVGQLRFATSGPDALRLARQSAPDLVLLDVDMPGMSGFEVCAALKATPELSDVPVIFVTSHDDAEQELAGLTVGCSDFIGKPPRPALMQARVRVHLRMKHLADDLRRAAFTDPLTGVANRRQFDETLQREWLRAQRNGAPLSLMMVDVDAFKRYNDHYGHQAGDACLRAVAQAMRCALHRPADLLARYGGEEFALLLPETDAPGAQVLASRLLGAVDALRLPHATSPVGTTVSVSVGVASYDQNCTAWLGPGADSRFGGLGPRPLATDLVATADEALYAAKEGGRRQARRLGLDDLGVPGRSVAIAGLDPPGKARP